MKVILPMAGRGSRFISEKLSTPKPLIPVLGKPMFEWALSSVETVEYNELIIIALKEHDDQFNIRKQTSNFSKKISFVFLDDITQGQLCTVLTAKKYINTEEDILIISSDSIVKSNIGIDIKNKHKTCEGIISVADMPGDRWSFAKTDSTGRVDLVTEKIRISNHASTGLYYFSNGFKFVNVAEEIIEKGEKTKGEFYVMPVYQKYIDRNCDIRISEAQEMWDLGTPESLEYFLKNKK